MARHASTLHRGGGARMRWRSIVIALLAAVLLAPFALARSALAQSAASATLRVGMQAPATLDPAYPSSDP